MSAPPEAVPWMRPMVGPADLSPWRAQGREDAPAGCNQARFSLIEWPAMAIFALAREVGTATPRTWPAVR